MTRTAHNPNVIDANATALADLAGPPAEQRDFAEVAAHFHMAAAGQNQGGPAQPYAKVAAVFRAVSFLSHAVASLPMVVSTDDDQVVEDGPLLDLIERPNDEMSDEEFFQATVGWMLLTRRAHWWIVERRGRLPVKLQVISGAETRPVLNAIGKLVGWRYKPADAAAQGTQLETLLPAEDVITLDEPSFDPARPYDGLSLIDVARKVINQVYKADIANERSLDNDMAPSGGLKTAANLTDDQRKELKQQILERYAGYTNRRTMLLLEGGLEWEPFANTFKDSEFSVLKKMSIADICNTFGVDPAALGYYEDSNYAHSVSAKASAWIDRVLPLAAYIAGSYTRYVLGPWSGDRSLSFRDATRLGGSLDAARRRSFCLKAVRARVRRGRYYAWFDTSTVPYVRKAALEMMKEGAIAVEKLKVPPGDIIDAFDLPFERKPWHDFAIRNATEIFVTEDDYLAQPGDDDEPGMPPTDKPDSELAGEPMAPNDDDEGGGEKARRSLPVVELSSRDRHAYWQAWRGMFSANEKTFRGRYRRAVFAMRNGVLDRLARADIEAGRGGEPCTVQLAWYDDDGRRRARSVSLSVEQRDLIGELLFDITAEAGKLKAALMPLVRTVVQTGGEAVMRWHAEATDQEEPDLFSIELPGARAALLRREVAIANIPTRIARRLRTDLATSLQEGKTLTELTEQVRHRFGVEANKAKTIAYQELSTAIEEGQAEAREQAGVPLKSWLWSQRETGRPEHAATEGHYMKYPITLAERFEIGGPGITGITCDHPRGTGVAEQDIHCGCTVLSRYPDDTIKSAVTRAIAAMGAAGRKD